MSLSGGRVAAALAAVLAVGVAVVYVRLMQDQGDDPPLWALALFLAGVVASVVAAARPGSVAPLVALCVLALLTLLSLLSVGVLLIPSLLLIGYACARWGA